MITSSALGSGVAKIATNVAKGKKNLLKGVGTAIVSGALASAAGAGAGKIMKAVG